LSSSTASISQTSTSARPTPRRAWSSRPTRSCCCGCAGWRFSMVASGRRWRRQAASRSRTTASRPSSPEPMPCRSSQPCFGMVRTTRIRWCRDSSDGWNGTSSRVSTRCGGRPAWRARLIAPHSSARTTYGPFTAGPKSSKKSLQRRLGSLTSTTRLITRSTNASIRGCLASAVRLDRNVRSDSVPRYSTGCIAPTSTGGVELRASVCFVRTVSTGHRAVRATASATLPNNRWASPVRP
jgi:hypothetical protein